MAGPGRNSRCPCGSGRKVKRCCGERKGPSDEGLARAYIASEARPAKRHLAGHDIGELEDLFAAAAELPAVHPELSVALPRLMTPHAQRVLDAIRDRDRDAVAAALPAVVRTCDSWAVRSDLARAVKALEDDDDIDACVAAAAIVDLSIDDSGVLETAVFAQLAIHAGVIDTWSGLTVAAG
jgi:hypothetical protein